MDLVPSLMTTHTVANPEYDPAEARQKEIHDIKQHASQATAAPYPPPPYAQDEDTEEDDMGQDLHVPRLSLDVPATSKPHTASLLHPGLSIKDQTTANVLQPTEATSIAGVSTTLSTTDENVTLDIRWTVLCDLFLILIADSVYDSRSRMLLETVAARLGLGWIDVVRFEKRVTDALEIQEGADKLEQKDVIEGRSKAAKQRRYVMMGLATLGEPSPCLELIIHLLISLLIKVADSLLVSPPVCWRQLSALVLGQLLPLLEYLELGPFLEALEVLQ